MGQKSMVRAVIWLSLVAAHLDIVSRLDITSFFPKVPRPAYLRGKNIRELLCRARLPPARRAGTRQGDRTEETDYLNATNAWGGQDVWPVLSLPPDLTRS